MVGELLAADFIHRRGQFRDVANGAIVDFALLPYGSVRYLDAKPICETLRWEHGSHSSSTRTPPALHPGSDAGRRAIVLGERANAEQNADALRAQAVATQAQREKAQRVSKQRGLPAWIDRVDGKRLTVTFFGDPAEWPRLCRDEGIDLSSGPPNIAASMPWWRTKSCGPTTRRSIGSVRSSRKSRPRRPTATASSGLRWVIEPRLLLEGFRKGHFVRIFAHPSWPVEDMPFGENVYTEAPDAKQEIEEAIQYPYRTDFANHELPWYQLQPGVFPPLNSHHRASGELTKIDVQRRRGEFRPDGGGDLVEFTIPPFGCVLY